MQCDTVMWNSHFVQCFPSWSVATPRQSKHVNCLQAPKTWLGKTDLLMDNCVVWPPPIPHLVHPTPTSDSIQVTYFTAKTKENITHIKTDRKGDQPWGPSNQTGSDQLHICTNVNTCQIQWSLVALLKHRKMLLLRVRQTKFQKAKGFSNLAQGMYVFTSVLRVNVSV